MDMRSIFITNGVGIVILAILLYVSRANVLRRSVEDKVYTSMVLGVMLGCFMEALSYALDGRVFAGSRLINHLANTYLFTVNLLLPFCVLVYVDLGLYGDPSRIWKCYKPQIFVGTIMLGATAVNLFVPITYNITDANVYERLPFGNVYYAVILYYCVTALMVTRRYERENGARSFFRIGLFLVPILVGASLQFMFYGLSLAWLAAAIGLTGLFMMQQNEMAYVDSLVDAYNRQYLDRVLLAWSSRGRGIVGAMLDIDYFKSINDTYGHAEGDNALRMVTDVLKRARCDDEWVFRYAGDEFVVLKRADETCDLDTYMERVQQELSEFNHAERPYALSLSYGVSCLEGNNVDAFMGDMDSKMYQMKMRHHQVAH